ncbi:hypothetical protein CRUP_014820 [Coryphaenoides rupestris]|nr:hypothetical protein CRUP_014820 [Coryphaenoides rupestris]
MSVFGTGTYASVSNVCGAAIHRGVVGRGGGPVRVRRLLGRRSYMSSYSNGVQSQSLSQWTASFSLKKTVPIPQEVSSQTSTTSLPAVKPECQVELAVVLDSSTNLGQRRFSLQKNFVLKMVSSLKVGPSGPHVGLVQAGTELYLSNSTKQLMLAIKELPYLGGDTNTGKAIQHVAEGFFLAEHGVRRGHPRVMLVLLDGWPSDDLEQAAGQARDSGINVFLLSVAKPAPEELPQILDKDYAKKVASTHPHPPSSLDVLPAGPHCDWSPAPVLLLLQAVCKDNGFFSLLVPSWFSTVKHVRTLSQRICSPDALLCS